MSANAARMTKGERDDLLRIVRSRTKALKSAAEQRAKELLAEFEQQMAAAYRWEEEPTWEAAWKEVSEAVSGANARIAERCKQLGIPANCNPSIGIGWAARGENTFSARRAELRTAAKASIDSIHAEARAKIENLMSDAEVRIYSAGIATDEARRLLDAIPTVEQMMPAVSLKAIAGDRGDQQYDHRGKPILRIVKPDGPEKDQP